MLAILKGRIMQKSFFTITFLSATVIVLLTTCSPSGPKDEEVLELAKKKFLGNSSNFLIAIKIQERKSSRELSERNHQVVFPIAVQCNYIRQGFKTGWIAGGGSSYFEPYYEDTEYNSVREFLFGKDNFERWIIVDSRNVQTNTVEHQRPASKSMEQFYRGKKR